MGRANAITYDTRMGSMLYPACALHAEAASVVVGCLEGWLSRPVVPEDMDRDLASLLEYDGSGVPRVLPAREADLIALVEKQLASQDLAEAHHLAESASAQWCLEQLLGIGIAEHEARQGAAELAPFVREAAWQTGC
jgi:hypothetical protein